VTATGERQAHLLSKLAELRPRLHRYCARMTGSVIDGEDALQEGLARAVEGLPAAGPLDNPEGWVFRIVHNAALDFLRRRARERALIADQEVSAMPDVSVTLEQRLAAAAGLRTFMHLPVAQRSCVVLMDVLGHTLEEIAAINETTIPAVKAALHRGRARLRALGAGPEPETLPPLDAQARALLEAYIDRFNARDFAAVREMLAEEVRCEVVARTVLHGKHEVAETYFGNYATTTDWTFVPGLIEGRLAMVACDAQDPAAPPRYFVLLGWQDGLVTRARDFRHARYVMEGADVVRLDAWPRGRR
jgi:RNA polymerase sigma-70 factor (ECF subfamily)